MLKIALSGCNGRMGQVITRMCRGMPALEIVAGFDVYTERLSTYPVYADPYEYGGKAGAIIDFSNASALPQLLRYCVSTKTPVVIATTGHTQEQLSLIQKASESIPVFKSANMSIGINLMADLLQRAAKVLGNGYDVEIIERHHNQKLDAPSGTALLLADAVSKALPYEPEYIYDRHEKREKRDQTEIGIHTVRGGTIVGDHEVLFAGPDEVIEIRHSALSREVFATGAIRAAIFLAECRVPGMYDMKCLLSSL